MKLNIIMNIDYVLINQNIHNTLKDIIDIIKYHELIEKNDKLLNKKLKKLINF